MALLNSVGKQLNVKQLQASSLAREIQGKGVSFDYTQYFKERRSRFRFWQEQNQLSVSLPAIEHSVKDKNYKRRSDPSGAKKNGWLGMLQRRKVSLEQEQQQTPDDVKEKEMAARPINALSCLYEELNLLTTRAKHYAVAHKCICNSLSQEMRRISRKGGLAPANYWQANRNIIDGNEQVQCNRRKLSIVFDEILELSLKIENLVSRSDAKSKEVLLCQNICCAANIFMQHIASRVSEETDLLLRQGRSVKVAENRMTVASPRRRLPFLFPDATSASGANSTKTLFDNLLYLFSCSGQGTTL